MDTQTVAVTLPGEVIYVSGSVNGIEYTWTNTDENRWEAVVARTASEIYVVSLTLIDSLGTTMLSNFTLYYGTLNLVTDRTERDVERWRLLHSKGWEGMTQAERAEWKAGLKGAYNYTDLNRVESAVVYIARRLTEAGYDASPEVKLSWTVKDQPTIEDMDRYLGNIAYLRSLLPLYPTTPKAPTTSKQMDYQVANDIEIILLDLDRQISAINQSWYYAGDVFAGEI